jgi:predicted nucleic acid-binding Zn ribbon protein
MLRPPPAFIPPLSWKLKTGPKEAALAEWRGVNLTEEEKAFTKNAKPIGSVMPGVLKNIGLDRKLSELEILKVWQHLMDPTVVAHAQPTGLVRGTLFVSVDSNPWLDEIVRYRRREILQRLQHSFGPDLIQRISFRVG